MTESESYYKNEAYRIFQEGYEKQTEGALEEAIGLYKKSIELYPTAEAYTFLGWAYSFQRRYDEAIEECRRAIDVDPEFGNPYNDIGAYLIEKGKLDEAIPWLEKATHAKRYESYCFPHYNLGRVWERKGEWQKALACYKNALQENPQYSLAERSLNRLQAMMN
ncbi:MAG: tetratricopeptide repeat protein [Candidatus Omnitrophica bacterium]|nr:tetratricopeptide repeat protein [Candidatus Omnitrophota bacterium]